MHHMIPLADAETLVSGASVGDLTYESMEHVTDYTAEIVFRDTRVGVCYMITAEYSTSTEGPVTYGFDTAVVEGNECVQATPVIRQTQTVTRWVPIEPLDTFVAEEAEEL